MSVRSWLRNRHAVALGFLLSAVSGLSPLLEHHPFEPEAALLGAPRALSVAATHAGTTHHFEASATETHAGCVACLLQRRDAGSHLPELPQIGRTQAARECAAVRERLPQSVLRLLAGGRAPPAA